MAFLHMLSKYGRPMTLFVVYALTLLVRWQEGHPAVKYLHEQSTIHVFGGVELAWGDI